MGGFFLMGWWGRWSSGWLGREAVMIVERSWIGFCFNRTGWGRFVLFGGSWDGNKGGGSMLLYGRPGLIERYFTWNFTWNFTWIYYG